MAFAPNRGLNICMAKPAGNEHRLIHIDATGPPAFRHADHPEAAVSEACPLAHRIDVAEQLFGTGLADDANR